MQDILQNRFIQLRLGKQAPQPLVLLFNLLEVFHLIRPNLILLFAETKATVGKPLIFQINATEYPFPNRTPTCRSLLMISYALSRL